MPMLYLSNLTENNVNRNRTLATAFKCNCCIVQLDYSDDTNAPLFVS